MRSHIAICIPAFNEENTIAEAVNDAESALKQITDKYQIIVINDGSIDSTSIILQELSRNNSKLLVINHEKNLGIAASLLDGYSAAESDYIFFNSADKQAPMSYILQMYPLMDRYDMVVGCFTNRSDHWLRLFYSRLYHSLIRILFGVKFHNVNALKLFKKQVYDSYENKLRSNLCIDVEMIIRAQINGYKVLEIPFEHYSRKAGKTKVVSIANTINTFCNLFILFIILKLEKIT